VPGSEWVVTDVSRLTGRRFGIAVHEERLINAVARSPKACYALGSLGYLAEIDAARVDARAFEHLAIFHDKGEFPFIGLPPDCALVQTDKPLQDDPELAYWLEKPFLKRQR
jgi:hypothetical protein